MEVRTERCDKWVRAYLGDVLVVDSRDPVLFWEEVFPVPGYAFPWTDITPGLLQESDGEPPSEPFFFLPKGPVERWFDLVVPGHTRPHAAWVRAVPELSELVVLSWRPGVLDRWLEEEEEVASHPRDPYKRVEAIASSRHVVVELDGLRLADSTRPVLLFETGLPTRYYLPREDVVLPALTPSPHRSHCPYKGIADTYWNIGDDPAVADAAWSYTAPLPAVGKVAGMVAFYNELVDITIDGVRQERPVTVFSDPAHRPAS